MIHSILYGSEDDLSRKPRIIPLQHDTHDHTGEPSSRRDALGPGHRHHGNADGAGVRARRGCGYRARPQQYRHFRLDHLCRCDGVFVVEWRPLAALRRDPREPNWARHFAFRSRAFRHRIMAGNDRVRVATRHRARSGDAGELAHPGTHYASSPRRLCVLDQADRRTARRRICRRASAVVRGSFGVARRSPSR